MTATAPTLTPEQEAQATYQRLVQQRNAAGYVMTRVPLELAVDAHRRYLSLAQAARTALETWMQFKTTEVC